MPSPFALGALGASSGLLARRPEPLTETAAEVETAGGEACWATAGIRDEAALAPALDDIVAGLGGSTSW